ncbi:MAG: hypothetical protein DI551_05500 [Micavibrio aeruginosavorus]|uniref:RING-type domain-containing protein n=1 Tax=Micavibrio aeruginosavorus TaxID=349221 RepID=A0A2W5MYD3_9BACT|nr:MAG: hypothetical protein DI551_05500 [Micavibrio aeruginosavorus]
MENSQIGNSIQGGALPKNIKLGYRSEQIIQLLNFVESKQSDFIPSTLCFFNRISTMDVVVCVICGEGLNNPRIVRVICGHIFHYNCISQWLRIGRINTKSCPKCRSPVRYTELAPIFVSYAWSDADPELDHLRAELKATDKKIETFVDTSHKKQLKTLDELAKASIMQFKLRMFFCQTEKERDEFLTDNKKLSQELRQISKPKCENGSASSQSNAAFVNEGTSAIQGWKMKIGGPLDRHGIYELENQKRKEAKQQAQARQQSDTEDSLPEANVD